MNARNVIIVSIFLLLLVSPVLAVNYTMPNYSAYNAGRIDFPNLTLTKDWMYYMLVTNRTDPNWDFPIVGFVYDLSLPFQRALGGEGVTSGLILMLILFGLVTLMSWRTSRSVTIPSILAIISSGYYALFLPESFFPYAVVLLAAAVTSNIVVFFIKE